MTDEQKKLTEQHKERIIEISRRYMMLEPIEESITVHYAAEYEPSKQKKTRKRKRSVSKK